MKQNIRTQNKSAFVSRPPIVVVMGHIDHGKTKLLDAIRKTDVVASEAGGITQHIGAYTVAHAGRYITFIDTPGHEAFAQMRSRGAGVADIAVLVVAADDGVKPQTKEALGAITAAGVPYCVAINKIDKPHADPERVKNELAAEGIFLEGRGGTVPYAEISAKQHIGIDSLLETIMLLAELEDLRYDSSALARGVVIESHRDPQRGITATLLVRDGVLKKNHFVIAGNSLSTARILENFKGESVDAIRASEPAVVVGFDELPQIGAEFVALSNKKEAQERQSAAMSRETQQHDAPNISTPLSPSDEEPDQRVAVRVILKTDTEGSGEALMYEIEKIRGESFSISVLRAASGDVSLDDITLAASAKNAIIIAFGVECKPGVSELAEKEHIALAQYTVIYDVVDFLKKHIEKLLPAEVRRVVVGKAKVLKIFNDDGKKHIIGGKVIEGIIKKEFLFSLLRRGAVVGEGKTESVQQRKIAVSEVGAGEEFGALVTTSLPVAPGDTLEFFEEEIIPRILS